MDVPLVLQAKENQKLEDGDGTKHEDEKDGHHKTTVKHITTTLSLLKDRIFQNVHPCQ